MDDLGLGDVSFDESSAEPCKIVDEVTPYKPPDSARVSRAALSILVFYVVLSPVKDLMPVSSRGCIRTIHFVTL